ncbi:MAG: hypothetical protein WCO28_08220 [Bacteroidota bacterium]
MSRFLDINKTLSAPIKERIDFEYHFIAGGKFGSFAFAIVLACVVGAKVNVPNVGWNKIALKKCVVGKIKNTEGLEISVGLVVVPL